MFDLTKIENILTHGSVAQAGSNYEEKNWRSKISLDCPFKCYLILFFLVFVIFGVFSAIFYLPADPDPGGSYNADPYGSGSHITGCDR